MDQNPPGQGLSSGLHIYSKVPRRFPRPLGVDNPGRRRWTLGQGLCVPSTGSLLHTGHLCCWSRNHGAREQLRRTIDPMWLWTADLANLGTAFKGLVFISFFDFRLFVIISDCLRVITTNLSSILPHPPLIFCF